MVPHLEDLSALQVAISHAFYYSSKVKNEDVKDFTANPRLSFTPECGKIKTSWYNSIDKRVENSLLKFPVGLRNKIPKSLVILFIRDIIRWIQFHVQEFDLRSEFCFKFLKLGSFFTAKGINKKLAARELINNSELSIHVRFCLACYYCFSEDISVLWRQIPDSEKSRFLEYKVYRRSEEVSLWCSYLLKQKKESGIFAARMKFLSPFDLCSEVSLKNCWQKLSTKQRRRAIENINKIFPEERRGGGFFSIHSDHLDVIKCILFDVNYEKFDYHTLYILLYHFLEWPYQEYFMKSLNHVWSTITELGFYSLLHRIVVLMRHQFSCRLYDYRSIFSEFWKKSPESFKRVVLDHESSDYFSFFKKKLKKMFLISKLFNPESYSEDDLCIIQLLLESSTKEQKLGIVKLQGEFICVKAISVGNRRIADLFIECCLSKENSASSFSSEKEILCYKKDVVSKIICNMEFFDPCKGLGEINKLIEWCALSQEECKDLKHQFAFKEFVCKAYSDVLFEFKFNLVDTFIRWSELSEDDVKQFKKGLVLYSSASHALINEYLAKGKLELVDRFFSWAQLSNTDVKENSASSFSLGNEILHYKKDLVSETICNVEYFDPCKELGEINRLIEWCALSQEECKDLKHQFAFEEFVCKAYSDVLFEFKFNLVDTFISWSELSEDDVKQFKKGLVLYSSDSHALINEYLAKGKPELVDRFFSWTQLSNTDVKEFKEKMETNLNLEKYFFVLKFKFEDIERVFNYIQLPEKKVKIIKKNFALKSDVIIKCIEQMGWDEVEEFVNWCFTSRKDCNWFKNQVFSRRGREITSGLICDGKFNDVDAFLNWVEIFEFEKQEFLKEIIHHDNYFLIVGKVLISSVREFERILDIMSGWELLTEEWEESFLAFLLCMRFEKKMCCNSNIHLKYDSCSFCSRLDPSSEDIIKYSEIISKHIKREETVTNSKKRDIC